jgi:hypothetical protein
VEIAEKEDELAAIEADMVLPETLRDREKIKAMRDSFAAVKADLARLYEHWEEATELNG